MKKRKVKKKKPKQHATKQIRVSPEVFHAIQVKAKPLVDTPDDVLRRLLHLPERVHNCRIEHSGPV